MEVHHLDGDVFLAEAGLDRWLAGRSRTLWPWKDDGVRDVHVYRFEPR